MVLHQWISLHLAFGITALSVKTTDIYRRIVGGNESEKFEYSWLATIQRMNSHICGGVLLNQDTMITAAHCYNGTVSPFLRVYAHRHNLFMPRWIERGLEFGVKSIALHPAYDNENAWFEHDVAVWKLELIRGDINKIPLKGIKLDDSDYSTNIKKLIIAGWGSTQAKPQLPSWRQRKKEVRLIPDYECRKTYRKLPKTGMCVIGANDMPASACYGDSGGPLFAEGADGNVIIFGLSSHGYNCGKRGQPMVYTKISAVLDWIKIKI